MENGATSEGGAIFFLNMIMKEKNGSTLQSGIVFQNSSRVEPFWLHLFLSALPNPEKTFDAPNPHFWTQSPPPPPPRP